MQPQQKMKSSNNEDSVQMKLEATKRKLHERYQEAENAKKQRTIQVMEIHELQSRILHRGVRTPGLVATTGSIGQTDGAESLNLIQNSSTFLHLHHNTLKGTANSQDHMVSSCFRTVYFEGLIRRAGFCCADKTSQHSRSLVVEL